MRPGGKTVIDLTHYYDRLILFHKTYHRWEDPWGKQQECEALQVRAILRPTEDETIRVTCQHYTIDPGYPDSKYVTYGYTIPNLGTVKRMVNVIDYVGGAWWTLPADKHDYVLHDKGTIIRERTPLLDMWGRPTAKGRLFS
jgi:hypothetical protein